MKANTHTFTSNRDKELFIKIILLSTLTLGAFADFKFKKINRPPIKMTIDYRNEHALEDFDEVTIPNKTTVIARMISVLKPEFSMQKRHSVASNIHRALTKYKIEPQIVVAIIDAESDFNHEMISSTGDLSMAQVNVDIWNKEFERMKMKLIKAERMKIDQEYSLEVMAQILNILKSRYQKKDKKWYARYHSKTHKYKEAYLSKLTARLNLLEKARVVQLH